MTPTDGLPVIPDEDSDFTPELGRKIIEQYQVMVRGLKADNADLGEENCELRKQIADLTDPTLKSMRLEDGSFSMELGGEAVKRLATIMTTWFRESGAKNYVEMSINATDEPFEKFLFYVQKRGDGAKTPAESALASLAEIDAMRSKLTFGALLDLAQEGLARWKDKEHNTKWWRQIGDTPIPNDLPVNIAEVIAEQFKTP